MFFKFPQRADHAAFTNVILHVLLCYSFNEGAYGGVAFAHASTSVSQAKSSKFQNQYNKVEITLRVVHSSNFGLNYQVIYS